MAICMDFQYPLCMFLKRQKSSSKLLKTNPSDVYILGRNKYAISASEIISFNGFIDETTSEKQFLNKQIVGFSALNSRSFVINASTMRPMEASKRISEYTKNQVHVFELLEDYSPKVGSNIYWREFREDFTENESEYREFEKSLCDSTSRALWEEIKFLRLTGRFKDLRKFPRSSGIHYFPNFIKFTKKDELCKRISSRPASFRRRRRNATGRAKTANCILIIDGHQLAHAFLEKWLRVLLRRVPASNTMTH
jgi:hypothetical protein